MTVGACPACLGTRSRRAFAVAGVEWRRCTSCRSLFDPDPPDPHAIHAAYGGREYYVKNDPGRDSDTLWGYADDYLADQENIERKFERILDRIERDIAPGRLLDVGSGPGFLLNAARRQGWETAGLDVNEWAVEHARDSLGLDVRLGSLAGAGFDGGSFDAVTMMDLIEHVPDAEGLVSGAAHVVRPGGVVAVLTPDAAAPVSRVLGRRWPEVRRPGEHVVLFSAEGLARILDRHGLTPAGRHSIGKEAPVETLIADAAPLAPAIAGRAREALEGTRAGRRVVDLDPRTKIVMYARRRPGTGGRPAGHVAPAVPKRAGDAGVELAILEELRHLAAAERLCDWMFDQFRAAVGPEVVEVGAGIGTFTDRLLAAGAQNVLAIEPEPSCATALEGRYGADRRVEVVRESLPGSPSLAEREGAVDLVLCQNVLEHIGDDLGAVQAMAAALRPGGTLGLLVPAGPRLFGPLDAAYGHWRRYTEGEVRGLLAAAGLQVATLRHFNALGILGWWTKNRRPGARVGPAALGAYEALVRLARPLEDRLRPNAGLSLVALATRPVDTP